MYPLILPKPRDDLLTTVSRIAEDSTLAEFALHNRLTINNITWEDTSRYKDSVWGDNITDQSLCVTGKENTPLPVIRRLNFTDETCDMDINNFSVMVGNERGKSLTKIPLQNYLENIGYYTGNSEIQSMYLPRDKAILTSSQFCVLPLKRGQVNFGVQLHNYQSDTDNPALLTIVASKEGTSTQAITKYNQVLYFNKNGRAHDFSAKRLSEDRESKGRSTSGEMDQDEQERNCLIVLHVPLLARPVSRRVYASASMGKMSMAQAQSSYRVPQYEYESALGLEEAVLTAGDEKGDFTGIRGSRGQYLRLERDPSKPIRAVLQFYLTTDTTQIKETAFQFMSDKINQVCASGMNTGSLVLSGTTTRPTETTTTAPMFKGFTRGSAIMSKN